MAHEAADQMVIDYGPCRFVADNLFGAGQGSLRCGCRLCGAVLMEYTLPCPEMEGLSQAEIHAKLGPQITATWERHLQQQHSDGLTHVN